MNSFGEIKALLQEKSGKKLLVFSVVVFLLITAIVCFSVFRLCKNTSLKMMDEYLGEIPKNIDSRANELNMRSRVFEEDVLARAELGLKLYGEESELTEMEKLERVRETVSAASVSLLDRQGKVLSTTGPVSPEENFRACIQALEPRSPRLELYPALRTDGEETEEKDGKGFVLLPIPENTGCNLVFEFSCDALLELYNALDDWSNVLEQMLSGGNAVAFAKTGDRLTGYPLDGFTPEQIAQLKEELTKVFQNTDNFRKAENGTSSKFITLLGEHYLATWMSVPQENTDILLTAPLKSVLGNGIFIAASISAIIGWGIVLLQVYIFRRLRQKGAVNHKEALSLKRVWPATRTGILVLLAVTVLFSGLLLLLESRSHDSFTATTKRESLQYVINWRKDQEDTIRNTFADLYRTRAQTLAVYLTEHPDDQTHDGLKELSRIAGSDYLMRFDGTGQELVSSNSYTGFSVGTNLSDDYRAVLLGYPWAVVGPAADPYTGQMQLGAAILMTDAQGQSDGFLLAVYSVGDLNAELKRMKYETAVNSFAVQNGHIAAAISNEDGRFIAHTDPEMIGLKAEDSLEDFVPGNSFEGFTSYKGKNMCVSASVADGRTLLFMVPARENSYAQAISVPAILAVLLILALLYYPVTGLLIARAMAEAKGKLPPSVGAGRPMTAFTNGYAVFLTLFAIFALIASYNGWWTTFDYVFSRQWSKGIHLFSIWAALFVLSLTLFCVFLIQAALRHLESRLTPHNKTVTRLADSFITYAAGIFLFFYILDMFGANTATLLASAGIISIAVGMGAQSMAADLLAGFFMMLEGSVHVGDHISVSGVTGIVTDMGIRTTEITDKDGNVITFNNNKVTAVCNMSRKPEQQELKNDPKN